MKTTVALTCALALVAGSAVAAEGDIKQTPLNTIFGQGVVNPYSDHFTGTTYLQAITAEMGESLSNVTFEPCARTDWHYHTLGQILLVLDGEGRFQERGQDPIAIKQGQVVNIKPYVEHWHGAGPQTWMTHIALMPGGADNQTVWLEPVTDEQYNKEVQP